MEDAIVRFFYFSFGMYLHYGQQFEEEGIVSALRVRNQIICTDNELNAKNWILSASKFCPLKV